MEKGLTDIEIADIDLFGYFDDEQALALLSRIDREEICGTHRVFDFIPLWNNAERRNYVMLRQSFWNWLRDKRFGLTYLTNGKITYTDTNGLDTYSFH